jgi:hypothetical protein
MKKNLPEGWFLPGHKNLEILGPAVAESRCYHSQHCLSAVQRKRKTVSRGAKKAMQKITMALNFLECKKN